jgi:hypothetical protein
LRSSPAASRKSRTFSTRSVSGRAGDSGRRGTSERLRGALRRSFGGLPESLLLGLAFVPSCRLHLPSEPTRQSLSCPNLVVSLPSHPNPLMRLRLRLIRQQLEPSVASLPPLTFDPSSCPSGSSRNPLTP